ncbi:MAG: trypsin-like peptidase domain-containing protein [Methanobacterium sp.]|nr:trypsin-like peptidase domain-containing protein [Methanobacterium sp.]
MKFKQLSLLILAVLIIVTTIVILQYSTEISSNSNNNLQTIGSVVYIENGVSGVVIINDPFLNIKTTINVIYQPIDTGTGFIVTNNGYIITALHVVGDLESSDTKQLKILNNSSIQHYIELSVVEDYIAHENPELGYKLGTSSADLNDTIDILKQRGLLFVSSKQQVIKVKIPNINQNFTAKLVDMGNPNLGEDIALLKLNTNLNNLSTLNISSKKPITLEKIHICGYPGSNDSDPDDAPIEIKPSVSYGFLTTATAINNTNTNNNPTLQSIIENIFNWIIISLKSQTVYNKSTYYGTTAVTTHGESGGPVFDKYNNVLGIIIFGVETVDIYKKQIKITSSLFISSNYIMQICKKNNVSINII